MLYIVCAVLYFVVVKGDEATIETENITITEILKKDTHFTLINDKIFATTVFINPVKTFFQNIDNRIKKLGVNQTSVDKVYNLEPTLYDYPEIWWTTTTDGKTFGSKSATTATEMNASKSEITTEKETTKAINKEATIETSVTSEILRAVRTQTFKPLIIKRPNVVINAKPGQTFGKRVFYKKRRVTRSTFTKPTEKALDYMFVVNKDDKKGDLSIDTKDQNMAVNLKKIDGTGLHVAVTAAFLLNKDVTMDDFDYIIIDVGKKNITNTGGQPDEYDYYQDISSNETKNYEKVVIKVINSKENDTVLDLLTKGAGIVLGPKATSNLTNLVQKKLYDKYKLTASTAKAIISQIPRQSQFGYNQNMNPYFQQMQMNQYKKFNGQNFNRHPMQQNPNLMRYPINRNAMYNPSQNINRNPFQQNGNYMRNYQNKGLFRDQFPQNAYFNRNPNANFNRISNRFNNNPNFKRYPFNQNPSVNIYRSPLNQNQNNNFNPIQHQNQNSFNPMQNQNNFNPMQNRNNFNRMQNQNNFNPMQNQNNFNRMQNQNNFNPMQNQNNFNPMQNQNNIVQNQNHNLFRSNVTTTKPTTETTTTANITNLNDTEKSTTVDDKPDPHDDPEAYLPTIPTTMPYEEMGLITTEAKTSTTPIRTITTTTPKLTRPTLPISVMTQWGGPGPPTGTTVDLTFHIPVTHSPYVKELINLQTELKAGYFSVAMVGLFEAIALKEKLYLTRLVDRWQNEFDNLNHINKLPEFGKPIVNAVESLTTALQTNPLDYLKEEATLLHHAMFTRKQTITMDINSVIDYIDTMFNNEDGIELLKAVENIKKYPNVTKSAAEVLRDFNSALLYPTVRYHNSIKLKILLDSLNQLLINHAQRAQRRHNSINRKLIEEQKKISEFKNKYNMIGNSTENDTKNKRIETIMTTPMKTIFKPVNQQRFKIKSNRNKTVNKTRATDVTVKTTTEEQATTDEDVFPQKYKSKFHPSKKISLTKLLRLKVEYPKLYNKYFKRKKHSHHTKDNRQNKHTNRARKRHSKHKLSKKDKLLLKYRIMELKYQKLLKKLNANNKDRGNRRKSTKGAHAFPINTNIKKTTDEVNEIGTESGKLPVAQHRVFSKQRKVSRKLNAETTIQKWLPIKTNFDEFVPYSINYYKTTEYPEVLSKKFKTFNKLPKPKKNNKVLDIVNPSSSYSDEEGIIRLNIHEAMNLNKANVRRHNTDELMPNKINRYSSYSSEEALLKSKIYKVFNDLSESYSGEDLDDEDKKELRDTVRKLLTRSYVKPVNRASSYSDDEEIIRQKLKI